MSSLVTSQKQWCGCGERLPRAIPRRLYHTCKGCGRTYRATLVGLTSKWVSVPYEEYRKGVEKLP